MALIGSSIDPRLFVQDFSGIADAAKIRAAGSLAQAQGIAGGLGAVASGVTDYFKQQKEEKNLQKEGVLRLERALKMFPDQKPQIEETLTKLKDENTPFSDRTTIAKSTEDLVDELVMQRANSIQDRELGMREELYRHQMGGILAQETAAANARAAQAAITPVQIDDILGRMPDRAKAEKYRGVLSGLNPEQQALLLPTIAAELPKASTKAPERQEVGDGKGGKMWVERDPLTGVWNKMKFNTVPITTYSTGKAVGGPDEMQDPDTNAGFTSTGRNLTPGVVAVNTKKYPLGTVFKDPKTGNILVAADRHGNKDKNVVDIYQLPQEYTGESGKMDLQVIGHEELPYGTTAEDIQAIRQKYTEGEVGTTPPPALSPSDQKALADMEADKAKRNAEQQAKVNRQASTLATINKFLTPKTGAPTQSLKDAVGFGAGVSGDIGSVTGGGVLFASPETQANQQELMQEVLESGILEALEKIKPASDTDVKFLKNNRPTINSRPEVWAAYMARLKRTMESAGMGGTSSPLAPTPGFTPQPNPYAAATTDIGSIFNPQS